MSGQYQIHFCLLGFWCGYITPDGVVTGIASGVRSLESARSICESKAGHHLKFEPVNGHFTADA